MKITSFRHMAIQVQDMENSMEFYGAHGFKTAVSGIESINGNQIIWVKMTNKDGFVLELVHGWPIHLAFTVDKLDGKKAIVLMPSGHKIQFEHDPDGNIIEYVEESK